MLLVEASVFFLFLGGFCTWLILSERVVRWRERKEAEQIADVVGCFEGHDISFALDRMGPPREQFTGSSGRSLFVWQCPPSTGMPHVEGLLVVMLTADVEGKVVESSWHRR